MSKGTSRAEVKSNSEKIKPVALAVIKLRLSEGISQSVSQKILFNIYIYFKFHSNLLKFHSNLLKVFRGNLKACLGLVLLNQYCLIIARERFLGDVFSWATPTPLWSLLYSTIVLYDSEIRLCDCRYRKAISNF